MVRDLFISFFFVFLFYMVILTPNLLSHSQRLFSFFYGKPNIMQQQQKKIQILNNNIFLFGFFVIIIIISLLNSFIYICIFLFKNSKTMIMGRFLEWLFPATIALILFSESYLASPNENAKQLDKMVGTFLRNGMKVFNKKNYNENQVNTAF